METKLFPLLLWMLFGCRVASAEDPEFMPGTQDNRLADEFTSAPYQIEPATWGRLVANPNATGHFPFKGPNVSEPYPANGSSHSLTQAWAISLDLKADIPLQQTSARAYWNTSNYASGGVMSLTPPDDLVNPYLDEGRPYRHHRTWKVCVYSPFPPVLWNTKLQKEMHHNDNCEAVHPPQCLDFFMSEIRSAFLRRYSDKLFKDDPDCPYIGMGSSCRQIMGHTVARDDGNHTMYSLWNMTLANEQLEVADPTEPLSDTIPYRNGSALFQWASDAGEKGNLKAWNDDVGLYWPVFVAFGFNETWMAVDANASNSSLPREPVVEYVCAKAQKAAPGSVLPESSASLVSKVSVWMLMTLGVAMIFEL